MSGRRCDIHAWTPVPLKMGVYRCECGATGRRDYISGGRVVADKKDRTIATTETARARGRRFLAPIPRQDSGASWSDGYRVEPLPALS